MQIYSSWLHWESFPVQYWSQCYPCSRAYRRLEPLKGHESDRVTAKLIPCSILSQDTLIDARLTQDQMSRPTFFIGHVLLQVVEWWTNWRFLASAVTNCILKARCLMQPSDELELQERVKQGLLLSMVVTLLMTGVMVSLAEPVVRIVFQRRAFDASACVLVSSLVICYALGSTFYLARDLLVRAFYALGDGGVPFKISVAAICANGVLDWILVQQAGYGAQGLVLATSLVNFVSTIALLLKLSCRLKGLQLKHWVRPLLLLGCSAVFSGLVTKASYNQLILFISLFRSMTSRSLWLADLFALLTASGLGVVSYFVPLFIFHVPELQSVLQLLKAKL